MNCRPFTSTLRNTTHWAMGLACALLGAGPVLAQGNVYPSQPVRIIVPTSPGAGMDAMTRLVAEKLSAAWGKPVTVENRPGGDGVVGVNAFRAAKGDPHTLIVADVGLASISTSVPRVQTIDPRTEFKPITDLFTTTFVIVAKPDRFSSLPDLIKKATQQPGRLNYGSAGSASGQRLSVEMLKARTKTHITYIPYRGNAEALTALIGGDVDLISIGLPPVRAHLESGRLKALASTAPARSTGMPGLPTVNESLGIKGYAAESWVGLYGPPGMSAEVAEKIQRDVATAMKSTEIDKFLKINDYLEGGSSNAAFTARMESDREKYRSLIQELKLSFD